MRMYVITGPSSCGKTTLTEHLQSRGFCIAREVAREVLVRGEYHPARDPFLFQREIARLQAAEEERIRVEMPKVAFLDRGFHDQIAFCRHTGVKHLPREIRTDAHYDGVFLLEMLPQFESDGVRVEKDTNEALRITEMVMEEYEKRNIPVMRVPVLTVAERAEFILKRIGE